MNHYDNLSLAQLQKTPRAGAINNEIKPTQAEWLQVLQMLRDGKTDREIRKEFSREEDGKQKGLSRNQIRMARTKWVNALTARQAEAEQSG
jgi:hypothetical protein